MTKIERINQVDRAIVKDFMSIYPGLKWAVPVGGVARRRRVDLSNPHPPKKGRVSFCRVKKGRIDFRVK